MSEIKLKKTNYIVEAPTPEGEMRREIRVADWNRIERKIKCMPQKSWYAIFKDVGYLLVGISLPTLLSLFVIDKANAVLYAIYVCIGIFSLFIGLIFIGVYMKLVKKNNEDTDEVLTDMSEIRSSFGIKETN